MEVNRSCRASQSQPQARRSRLDKDGAGQAAFTVTNTSSKPVRGRVLASALPPAEASWFSISEPTTFEFAPGEARSVVAQIAVRKGTKPGTYSVRCDAVAEENPDEDFTEGPSVSFEVAAEEKKKGFPWWIVAVAAVVILGAIAAIVLATRGGGGAPAKPVLKEPANVSELPSKPVLIPVAWDAVEGADKYRVQGQTCPSFPCTTGTDTVVQRIARNSPECGIQRDVGRVQVIALNGDKESDPSDWREFHVAPSGGGGTVHPCKACLEISVEKFDKLESPSAARM